MTVMLSNADMLALAAASRVMMPPPPIDYELWARDNIAFSKRESPFPGPYSSDMFPFFAEILHAFGPDDPCRVISFKKSAQLGGTVLAVIFTLGTQALDPTDFLYVHPTEDNAARWSKLKLKPMLKATASISALFPSKPRDSGDSVFLKERVDGRGSILISGANSPASLSMVTAPKQVQDDLAKWRMNDAGDPEQQADARSRAHEFAKILKVSTPLIAPGCRITTSYENGSQETYLVPCPHCAFEHALEWQNMLANLDEAHPEKAHFTCPECGCEIHEYHRRDMVRKGRWHAQNPAAAREHRSFYLWSAYGPLQSWERIAREWIKAKGDPAREQEFLNDAIGLAFDAKGEAPPWEALRDRAANTGIDRGHIPAWGLFLTMGLDVQKDRVEWQLVAWGRNLRRYVVDAGIVTGHISEPATMTQLSALTLNTWPHVSGRKLGIELTAIDGNAWTEEVWGWAKRHTSAQVIMVRGVAHETAPLFARVQRERDRQGQPIKHSKRFYNFGTSVLKMALYRNAVKTDPEERGYIGFAKGLPDEYFRQFTAEHRKAVRRPNGHITYAWEKDPNQANEMLDTMLQAEAAAIKVGVRTMPDKIWDRLEKERAEMPKKTDKPVEAEAKPAEPEKPTEPETPDKVAVVTAKVVAAKRPKRRMRSYGIGGRRY